MMMAVKLLVGGQASQCGPIACGNMIVDEISLTGLISKRCGCSVRELHLWCEVACQVPAML